MAENRSLFGWQFSRKPTDNKNDSWVMEINKEKESLEWLIN